MLSSVRVLPPRVIGVAVSAVHQGWRSGMLVGLLGGRQVGLRWRGVYWFAPFSLSIEWQYLIVCAPPSS